MVETNVAKIIEATSDLFFTEFILFSPFCIIILMGRNSYANLLRLEKHDITQPVA